MIYGFPYEGKVEKLNFYPVEMIDLLMVGSHHGNSALSHTRSKMYPTVVRIIKAIMIVFYDTSIVIFTTQLVAHA